MATRARKTPAGADAPPAPTVEAPDAAAKPVRKRAYVLDAQIGFLIRKAHQRHLSIFAAHMPESLTAQQFAVMAKLNEVGPASQNSLGRQTAMDNSTINGVVVRLVERGLVEKVPAPEDRRMHLVQLTAEGRRTIGRVLPMASEITRMTLAPLSRTEQATLVRLLKRLG
ncbi:MarR family winged helix-turn-helix transcriptional regulator [Salinarimonas chemoclinalis]|uniref:MarR family winged helix-turn-helix transcriptional regulator n=1 Tax=Salinarimonas chemoclinalis TaxID=3241599 RepID=UPI00355644DB